jgi:hypothetical protein
MAAEWFNGALVVVVLESASAPDDAGQQPLTDLEHGGLAYPGCTGHMGGTNISDEAQGE